MLDGPIEAALRALSGSVSNSSHRSALLFAVRACVNFTMTHGGRMGNPHLYFVDYGLDNRTRRGYVFNMSTRSLVDGPFSVAHGSGSSTHRNGVPTVFSNGRYASSLGLYRTANTYSFTGHYTASGGASTQYTATAVRLDGLSGRFNDRARVRGVVMHTAPYVTANDSGTSLGCPAVEEARRNLVLTMAAGGLVFLFSPNDQDWMDNDPWVHYRTYPTGDARITDGAKSAHEFPVHPPETVLTY